MSISSLKIAVALATGCVTVAGAAAQPSSAPAVASCDAVSRSFIIAGTDACLRIGGWVSASYGTQFTRPSATVLPSQPRAPLALPARNAISGSRIDTAVSVDVRAQTELGPVRAYVSLRRSRATLP